MATSTTRMLICGLGSIGRRHLNNLMALGVRDIALFRTGKATLQPSDLPDLPVFSDLQQALDSWQPTAMVVANPTSLHLEVAMPAAERGVHLLIEKPVSHSLDGLESLRSLVTQQGSRVLIGYQFRYDPCLIRMQTMLVSGELGDPVSATAYWGEYLPGWHPWEDFRDSYSARPDLGGGVTLTLSHPLDYLNWLLGGVREVSARMVVGGALGLEVDEVAEITLQHDSFALSHVHLDYARRPPRHDLEVVCERGIMRWDGLKHMLYWTEANGGDEQVFSPGDGFERNTLFRQEMEHFLGIVRGEEEPACGLEQGIEALRLCLAALESHQLGKSISLPRAERVS